MTNDQDHTAHLSQMPGRVVVVRSGQRMSIEPPCPEILEVLSTKVRRPVSDDPNGCRIGVETEPLLMPPQRPERLDSDVRRLIATAGLAPIAQYLALKASREVTVRWESPRPAGLPQPNIGAALWAGACNPQVLDFIRRRERGLIRYVSGRVEVWRLILQIALAFPEATIAVMSASKQKAQYIHRKLRKWLPGVTWATAKHCPPDPGRIVVAPFAALAPGQDARASRADSRLRVDYDRP